MHTFFNLTRKLDVLSLELIEASVNTVWYCIGQIQVEAGRIVGLIY